MPISEPALPTIRYHADPHLVADALLRRLLAGRAFLAARELEPA
jgi:hypothetical protein